MTNEDVYQRSVRQGEALCSRALSAYRGGVLPLAEYTAVVQEVCWVFAEHQLGRLTDKELFDALVGLTYSTVDKIDVNVDVLIATQATFSTTPQHARWVN